MSDTQANVRVPRSDEQFPAIEAVVIRRAWCRAQNREGADRITIDRLPLGSRVLTFGSSDDFEQELICVDDNGAVHHIDLDCLDLVPRDATKPPTLRESLMSVCRESFDDFDETLSMYASSIRFARDLRGDIRVCADCEQVLPIENFPRVGVNEAGNQRRSSICAACRKSRYRRR